MTYKLLFIATLASSLGIMHASSKHLPRTKLENIPSITQEDNINNIKNSIMQIYFPDMKLPLESFVRQKSWPYTNPKYATEKRENLYWIASKIMVTIPQDESTKAFLGEQNARKKSLFRRSKKKMPLYNALALLLDKKEHEEINPYAWPDAFAQAIDTALVNYCKKNVFQIKQLGLNKVLKKTFGSRYYIIYQKAHEQPSIDAESLKKEYLNWQAHNPNNDPDAIIYNDAFETGTVLDQKEVRDDLSILDSDGATDIQSHPSTPISTSPNTSLSTSPNSAPNTPQQPSLDIPPQIPHKTPPSEYSPWWFLVLPTMMVPMVYQQNHSPKNKHKDHPKGIMQPKKTNEKPL